MKSGIVFSGTGPILILTTFDSLTDSRLVNKLSSKGIKKFIAYELPVELVREKYSTRFGAVMNDIKQTDDLRVLDYNGHGVLNHFSFSVMGPPLHYEPSQEQRSGAQRSGSTA